LSMCPVLPVSLDCQCARCCQYLWIVNVVRCCQYLWIVNVSGVASISGLSMCRCCQYLWIVNVPGVASISGLSILDCAFGFLKRLCRIVVPLWQNILNGDGQQFPRYQLTFKSLNAKITQYMVLGSEVITWHGGKCGRIKTVNGIPSRDNWIYNNNRNTIK
jgi:hypothetical protein